METDPRLVQQVRSDLDQAATADDATRLKTLDDLYRSLESELEGDIDQTGSPRH